MIDCMTTAVRPAGITLTVTFNPAPPNGLPVLLVHPKSSQAPAPAFFCFFHTSQMLCPARYFITSRHCSHCSPCTPACAAAICTQPPATLKPANGSSLPVQPPASHARVCGWLCTPTHPPLPSCTTDLLSCSARQPGPLVEAARARPDTHPQVVFRI